ncbi:hypothetical protein NE237_000922 [Protea cynaroides]|uniref:RNase H type-1 domain-containing protein n=1 Tax=Protea cynaroides TaxID=273540 RepID=A0A9Q0KT70_9MAGN|nr:hypothetical protein NE237_000922 [Protea cynaroides]
MCCAGGLLVVEALSQRKDAVDLCWAMWTNVDWDLLFPLYAGASGSVVMNGSSTGAVVSSSNELNTSWQPPSHGFVKLNTDAATGEAMAIRAGLYEVIKLGFLNIQIESDCLSIINVLFGRSTEGDVHALSIAHDIVSSSALVSVSFSFVY